MLGVRTIVASWVEPDTLPPNNQVYHDGGVASIDVVCQNPDLCEKYRAV
jgi:hypothetical protein